MKRLKKQVNLEFYRHPDVEKWLKELTTEELREVLIRCRTSGKISDGLYERLPERAFKWAKMAGPAAEELYGNQGYDEWPNWALEAVMLFRWKYGSREDHTDL